MTDEALCPGRFSVSQLDAVVDGLRGWGAWIGDPTLTPDRALQQLDAAWTPELDILIADWLRVSYGLAPHDMVGNAYVRQAREQALLWLAARLRGFRQAGTLDPALDPDVVAASMLIGLSTDLIMWSRGRIAKADVIAGIASSLEVGVGVAARPPALERAG